MNILAANKNLAFVGKLFAAAKLNLEDFIATGDESALQAHLDAQRATPTAPEASTIAAKDTEIADLKSQLAAANAANSKHDVRHTALVATLAAAGVKFAATDKPEALAPALEARISTRAGEELAKHGLRDFPAQQVEADPTKPAAATKIDPKLTGRDRYAADFNRQLQARIAGRN